MRVGSVQGPATQKGFVEAAYSDLKAAHHLEQIAALRLGEQIVPRQVQLILSDLCNQGCSFCAYRMDDGLSVEKFAGPNGEKNPNRMIPAGKAREIIEDCAELGVMAIQFTGGGEPTVHPAHMALFEYASSLGMRTALVTNGLKLESGWEDTFPKMSWIRVSLDAGTADTYGATRQTPVRNFNRVQDNISMISAAIRDAGSDCYLGVGFVVTPENYKEIGLGVRAARSTGAAYVRMSAMFSKNFMAPFIGIYDEIKELVANAKAECETATFKVVDLFGERLADLQQHAPDYEFCGYQQFNMYIGGDLNVYRCCSTSYTEHGKTGTLTNMRLRDWFLSEAKREAYGSFDARSCRLCQFNTKNRVINYMVSASPQHVEFV